MITLMLTIWIFCGFLPVMIWNKEIKHEVTEALRGNPLISERTLFIMFVVTSIIFGPISILYFAIPWKL